MARVRLAGMMTVALLLWGPPAASENSTGAAAAPVRDDDRPPWAPLALSDIPDPPTEVFCRKQRENYRKLDFRGDIGDDQPVPLIRVPPEWPGTYRGRGYVIIEFTVKGNGRTADIQVIKTDNSAFEAAAIRAVEQWRYCPVFKDGVPVESKAELRLEFSLDADERI